MLKKCGTCDIHIICLEEFLKQKIFFEGQIYDAYSLIIDIIKKANKKI